MQEFYIGEDLQAEADECDECMCENADVQAGTDCTVEATDDRDFEDACLQRVRAAALAVGSALSADVEHEAVTASLRRILAAANTVLQEFEDLPRAAGLTEFPLRREG